MEEIAAYVLYGISIFLAVYGAHLNDWLLSAAGAGLLITLWTTREKKSKLSIEVVKTFNEILALGVCPYIKIELKIKNSGEKVNTIHRAVVTLFEGENQETLVDNRLNLHIDAGKTEPLEISFQTEKINRKPTKAKLVLTDTYDKEYSIEVIFKN